MTVPSQPTQKSSLKQAVVASLGNEVPQDALRTMLQSLIQETLNAEFVRFLGAAPYERSLDRSGWRNGVRERTLVTRVGRIELSIPRDRAGEFQPSLFGRYQRSEQAFVLALAEMYVQGVSTRKVTRVVEQLCGTTISASTVSSCTKQLDATLSAWRKRRLDGTSYPYLIIDAHQERIRREGQVLSTAALWVIGVRADGYREHLGIWTGASESAASWGQVFRDLTRRGLSGVTFAVSDEHEGLVRELRRYFPKALHQRCQVHYLRNALGKVTSHFLQAKLRDDLRDVWTAPSREEAERRLAALCTELVERAPKLVEWLEETASETLTFYALREAEARRRLSTTNAIEHDHAEVRRRTRVIRIFPNEESFLRLVTALSIERNDLWASRRYFIQAKDEQLRVQRFLAAKTA